MLAGDAGGVVKVGRGKFREFHIASLVLWCAGQRGEKLDGIDVALREFAIFVKPS